MKIQNVATIGAVIGAALLVPLTATPAAANHRYETDVRAPYGYAEIVAVWRFNPSRVEAALRVEDRLADGYSVSVQLVTEGKVWRTHINNGGNGTSANWMVEAPGWWQNARVQLCRHHTRTDTLSQCLVSPYLYPPSDA